MPVIARDTLVLTIRADGSPLQRDIDRFHEAINRFVWLTRPRLTRTQRFAVCWRQFVSSWHALVISVADMLNPSIDARYGHVCAWCGHITAEGDLYPLECCRGWRCQ